MFLIKQCFSDSINIVSAMWMLMMQASVVWLPSRIMKVKYGKWKVACDTCIFLSVTLDLSFVLMSVGWCVLLCYFFNLTSGHLHRRYISTLCWSHLGILNVLWTVWKLNFIVVLMLFIVRLRRRAWKLWVQLLKSMCILALLYAYKVVPLSLILPC